MNRNQLKRKARNVLQYYGEEVDKNRINLFIDNRTEQEIDNMILEIKTLKRKKKEINRINHHNRIINYLILKTEGYSEEDIRQLNGNNQYINSHLYFDDENEDLVVSD